MNDSPTRSSTDAHRRRRRRALRTLHPLVDSEGAGSRCRLHRSTPRLPPHSVGRGLSGVQGLRRAGTLGPPRLVERSAWARSAKSTARGPRLERESREAPAEAAPPAIARLPIITNADCSHGAHPNVSHPLRRADSTISPWISRRGHTLDRSSTPERLSAHPGCGIGWSLSRVSAVHGAGAAP